MATPSSRGRNGSDRQQDGRFAAGNSGGPGRPKMNTERVYLRTLGEAVTVDDWHEIINAAVSAAKSGDARARDWLSRYLLGDSTVKTAMNLSEMNDELFAAD